MDKYRKKLKAAYPTFEKFKETFEIPQSVTDNIIKEGEKKDIKPQDDDELQRTLPYLKAQMKALVARDLWDMSEYYSIFNERSAIVSKALQVLKAEPEPDSQPLP